MTDAATHQIYMITPVWTVSKSLQRPLTRHSPFNPTGSAYTHMINPTYPARVVSSFPSRSKHGGRNTHINLERSEIRPVYPQVLVPLVHRQPVQTTSQRGARQVSTIDGELKRGVEYGVRSTHMSPQNVPNRTAP